MAHRSRESLSSQVKLACQELDSSEGLPFRHLLDPERVMAALACAGVEFRERVYSPMVTLWAFLSQVLARKGSSCRDAVSRVLAERVARGEAACSPDTSSYCEARARLPEPVLADLTRGVGRDLHRAAPSEWLWHGRHVAIVDGSTVTLEDTSANQQEYPQSRNQKPGLGFPQMRFVVMLSLAVGTVLECAMGAARGKQTGEQSLFRQMWDALQSGDIVLADRLYDSYRDIAALKQRGIDSVFGKKQSRHCDFRRGRSLGKDDHIVVWKKPAYDSSRFESRAQWEALPDEMEMRELRTVVRRKGYRTRTVTLVTTLLDAEAYSAKDLTDLFSQRWHCELDLRSIKQSLGMHHLKCKTPEMVRKELWAHLLAYNLIRVRMAQAAARHGAEPRKLSFSAAQTLMRSFAPHLEHTTGAEHLRIEDELLKAIARSRIKHRPGRKEPRAVKRRTQKYSYLTKPRSKARKGLKA